LDLYAKEHFIYVGTSWESAQKQCYGFICFKYIYVALIGATGTAILLAGVLRWRLRNRGLLSVNEKVMAWFPQEDKATDFVKQ
jgi:hypothetical protein